MKSPPPGLHTTNIIKISIDLSYPTFDHACNDCLYITINVPLHSKHVFALSSRGQPSFHNQNHNYNTLSFPQECALQLHQVCVACFDVQELNIIEEDMTWLAFGFEVL